MRSRASDLVDQLASDGRAGLIFVDEYGHRRDYTFAELATISQRYAAVLRAFGVKKGDRVYVCLSASAKCIFALLALERVGADAILDPAQVDGASAVIANRKSRAAIDENRGRFAADACYVLIGEECDGWARLDTVAQMASPVLGIEEPADETALTHARAQASEELCAVETDVVWCALHIGDGGWFHRALVQPWLLRAATVVHDHGFDAKERLDLVRELEVTILLQRAGDYHAQLALPEPKRFKMPRLRRCLLLDGAGDDLLEQQWGERFGVPLTPYAAV
ncbi:MAG TPA: AMP-binding protein [Candidatus Baltobacteraceae bacterium]